MSSTTILTLQSLPDSYAVAQLPAGTVIPEWATRGPLFSITRTTNELSIVCRDEHVPPGVRAERGWRCLRIAETFDLAMIDILAALINALIEDGIAMWVVSTMDTDYLLVKQQEFAVALRDLRRAGHRVDCGPPTDPA